MIYYEFYFLYFKIIYYTSYNNAVITDNLTFLYANPHDKYAKSYVLLSIYMHYCTTIYVKSLKLSVICHYIDIND